jgi:hypothetical protein
VNTSTIDLTFAQYAECAERQRKELDATTDIERWQRIARLSVPQYFMLEIMRLAVEK